MRSKGIVFLILLALLVTFLPAHQLHSQWGFGSYLCAWFSGGCYVEVLQVAWSRYDLFWRMSIWCFFPLDFGYWFGWGEWGGECPFWFPL